MEAFGTELVKWPNYDCKEVQLKLKSSEIYSVFNELTASGYEVLASMTSKTANELVALIAEYPILHQKTVEDLISIAEGYQTGISFCQLLVKYQKKVVGYAWMRPILLPNWKYVYEKTIVTDTLSKAWKMARLYFKEEIVRKLTNTEHHPWFIPHTLGQALSDGIVVVNEVLDGQKPATIAWVSSQMTKQKTSPVLGYSINKKNKVIPAHQFQKEYPWMLEYIIYPFYGDDLKALDTERCKHAIIINQEAEKVLEWFRKF